MKGSLVLEDGTIFNGYMFGALQSVMGELVFNTSMTGYQEILTDPSYVNQMVIFTYPLIGNYGFNEEDVESASPKVNALIVKELCREPSNFRSAGQLEQYLESHGITGIEGIDTRALTILIRNKGSMRGIIVPEGTRPGRTAFDEAFPDPVEMVTSKFIYTEGKTSDPLLAMLDFGVKATIKEQLLKMGFSLRSYPARTSAASILADHPAGILLSNGPGNPKDLPDVIENIKQLIDSGIPTMGICLGHQLLGLAFGGNTAKLPFGHRGGNHPVKNLQTGKVAITSQNHSYTVEESSLPDTLVVTHRNLNDGTIEGLCHRQLPVFSVQYHPEASPGPADSVQLFEQFREMIEKGVRPCRSDKD
jgi:carbamoyl-phosphate synthase small subunit